MDPLARRRLGLTEVEVTQLGFGGAGLGDLFEVIPEAQAAATLQAAWDAGIRYYDTDTERAPLRPRALSPAAPRLRAVHQGRPLPCTRCITPRPMIAAFSPAGCRFRCGSIGCTDGFSIPAASTNRLPRGSLTHQYSTGVSRGPQRSASTGPSC